jgi:rubrerythrin
MKGQEIREMLKRDIGAEIEAIQVNNEGALI